MKENAPPGSRVGEISVQDADIGNPRALQLRLIDEADNDYFILNDIQRDLYTGTYTAVVETTNYTLDAEDEFIRENLGRSLALKILKRLDFQAFSSLLDFQVSTSLSLKLEKFL